MLNIDKLWKEKIPDFKHAFNLTLEAADYRLFTDPYGPVHTGAVGRLTEHTKTSQGWFKGKEVHLRTISPKLPDAEYLPVDVIFQDERIIIVKVDYYNSRYIDLLKLDGQQFYLFPWGDKSVE